MTDQPRDWEELRDDAIRVVGTVIKDGDLAEQVTDLVLSVIDEEATRRYCDELIAETRIKSMDFSNGAVMEIVPARDAALGWVAAARALLDGAPNYSETVMEFGIAEDPQRYAFTAQKIGKLTPHQARQRAEAERDELRAEVERLQARDAAGSGSVTARDRLPSLPARALLLSAYLGRDAILPLRKESRGRG